MTDKVKKLEILLIEDNKDDAELIEKSLDSERYHIINIWDGKKALDFLITQDNDIDIVLLDKSLPYKNGLEILKETREKGKEYAFIFLTIDNTVETAVEAMKLGALDFLPKTSGFEGLPEMIGKVYEIHQNKMECKEAERLLIANEEKYHSLVTNIPDVVWTSNSEGKNIYISPNSKNILGYSPEEIYEGGHKIWFGRIEPEDVERVEIDFKKLFEKRTIFDVEYRIKSKDGEWIWLHDRSINTYERDGVMYTDGILTDITERKQTEKALKKKMNELEIFNDAAVDRELIINELRKEINELLKELGKEPKYEIVE